MKQSVSSSSHRSPSRSLFSSSHLQLWSHWVHSQSSSHANPSLTGFCVASPAVGTTCCLSSTTMADDTGCPAQCTLLPRRCHTRSRHNTYSTTRPLPWKGRGRG
uniref:Uncharacterized protein n=1 Tax=Arundo donax TaxID=35708 RepID=A0A0A9ANH3_ARUDO